MARLTKRLQDNLGLDRKIARWGVETWALALGKLSGDDLTIGEEKGERRTRRGKVSQDTVQRKEPEEQNELPPVESKAEEGDERERETQDETESGEQTKSDELIGPLRRDNKQSQDHTKKVLAGAGGLRLTVVTAKRSYISFPAERDSEPP
jgi:hypothetical protein